MKEEEGRPIVFVDIDGVLNTGKNYGVWNAAHDADIQEKRERGELPLVGGDDRWHAPVDDPHVLKLFDRELVSRLEGLCEASHADVVVSSSWRLFYASRFGCLKELLRVSGLSAAVIGPTPTNVPERWSAIESWLSEHRHGQSARYVILDDDTPRFKLKVTDGHLVRTVSKLGLTEENVDQALKCLRKRRKIS